MSAIDDARQALIDSLLVERHTLRQRRDVVEGFLGDLLRTYSSGGHMDLDGCDVQDLLDKHKLTTPQPLTAEQAEEEWAQEYDMQEGDIGHIYTPLMKEILRNDF